MTNQNPMTLPVYSDQAISRMFCDYVDSTNCKERHTAAAVRDYDVFADYVENETRSSNTVQNALLEKAMDFAVEYEESGFIAGGCGAMQELVAKVFPADARSLPR